jgi:hypothetical protein
MLSDYKNPINEEIQDLVDKLNNLYEWIIYKFDKNYDHKKK